MVLSAGRGLCVRVCVVHCPKVFSVATSAVPAPPPCSGLPAFGAHRILPSCPWSEPEKQVGANPQRQG